MERDFLHIIRVNQGIIHKVCNMYCDREEDRNDLFQEIIAQLWKSYPSFRNESKVSTWMYRVGLNTAITSFRKNKRRPDQNSLSVENFQMADENPEYETEENIKQLHRAVAQLTGVEKSIVLLFLENKKYEEIAEITGITQNYVRVKMNRIKKKLKILMNEEDKIPIK
ncbi:MAG: sigma-70 family RNA polymerase sigma factor [Mariniphaga sp.]|nr:sigma-70 family RNA polymerase sigma factor [Mariniphaga sp.]MDD4424709.1 sigma-70 family RNA polymerase sigma factor [Mariniphaga sp.]